MTLEAALHGESPPAAVMSADEGAQVLVEGADVALQVEHGGVGAVTALSGALVDDPGVGVDALVLLEEP